jgi:hypothetical protein
MVEECRKLMDELGTKTSLSLFWIPAHRSFKGNEIADELAKAASEKRFCGPQPALPVPIQKAHEAIRQWARKNHRDRWTRMVECSQTRRVLKIPKRENGTTCCQLGRKDIYLLTQMVTGHANLKKHLHKMGLFDDAACDKCGLGLEDRDHFVCKCEAYCEVRLATLGSAFVDPSDLSEIPLRSILEFIKRSGRLDKSAQGDSSVQ